MNCPVCKSDEWTDTDDGEMVCDNCGASFGLELLGFYKEGASSMEERIESGKEFVDWCKKYNYKGV